MTTPTVTIENFRPYVKNTLRAFFDASLPSGMIIRGLSLHVKNTSRWVGLPSKEFTKKDGGKGFTPILEFRDHAAQDKFRDLILAALDAAKLAPQESGKGASGDEVPY